MTTTIKFRTIKFTTLLVLGAMSLFSACSEEKSNAPKTDATAQAAPAAPTTSPSTESITINGMVTAITLGKDGYSADVQTEKDGIYAAMVSMVNLGGPDKFQSAKVGDKVSFKGIPSTLGTTKTLKVQEIISITNTQTVLAISSDGFGGIKVGDAIAKHKDVLKKTKMKTGEGSFDVYQITDIENSPAGYLLPDPNNKLLVGDIVIETGKAQTAEGISVGDTFQALLKAFPNIVVHGSEIESRTTATANNITYHLNVANNQYNLDKAKIPATAKILDITINRKK
jgi:hypothetical protein